MSDYDRDMEDLDDRGRGRGRGGPGGGRFGPRRNKFCNFCVRMRTLFSNEDSNVRFLLSNQIIKTRKFF